MDYHLVGAKPLSEPMLEFFFNLTRTNKILWNFNRNSDIFIQENPFENVVCQQMSAIRLELNVLSIAEADTPNKTPHA